MLGRRLAFADPIIVFHVLGGKTSSFLFCSRPNSSTTTPVPSSSIPPSEKTPTRLGSPMRSISLNRWTAELLVGIGVCAFALKVLVKRLTGVGMWNWLARRSRR
jgi:hypothetical protein